jgi:hypothetical protein
VDGRRHDDRCEQKSTSGGRTMVEDSVFKRWRSDPVARRWHALAKRRRDHLAELYDSGRWRRYYKEEVFRAQMRDAVREVEHWQGMAGDEAAPAEAPREPSNNRAA